MENIFSNCNSSQELFKMFYSLPKDIPYTKEQLIIMMDERKKQLNKDNSSDIKFIKISIPKEDISYKNTNAISSIVLSSGFKNSNTIEFLADGRIKM